MHDALAYLWRHPRRTGFIALNLIVLAAFVGWGVFTANMTNEGLGGVPNLMLGYTGLALLTVLWLAAWIAWGWLVASRQMRRKSG
ncbi:MAG: hypothetical protein EOP22_09145 [Hyphomicrobiales bacterium]|nr:MAG: hypothetical protein EOP22_09145 [Hyphomicrobiales bacterium]